MTDPARYVPMEQRLQAAREQWLSGCVSQIMNRVHEAVSDGKFVVQYATNGLLTEPLPDVATQNAWTRRVAAAVRAEAGNSFTVTEEFDHGYRCSRTADVPTCQCRISHLRITVTLPLEY